MKQNKYILFSIFLIIFIFLRINSASALEVDLGLGMNPTLPQYVSFFFTWIVGIAGIISLISFTVGAIGLIVPDPESHSSAKDRMKGAVIGLIITLASFIILQTINPKLLTPTLTQGPPPPPIPASANTGVAFYPTANCSGTPFITATTSENFPSVPNSVNIQSVQIINDPSNDNYFGYIIHRLQGLGVNAGDCTNPVTVPGCNLLPGCSSGPIVSPDCSIPGAVDIITTHKLSSHSNGISFYSEPAGFAAGADAGVFNIYDNQIRSTLFHYYASNPTPLSADSGMPYSYIGVDPDGGAAYITLNPNFQARPGSIAMNGGNYLVGIYTKNPLYPTTDPYPSICQTYDNTDTEAIQNLRAQALTKRGSKIGFVYIIPE